MSKKNIRIAVPLLVLAMVVASYVSLSAVPVHADKDGKDASSAIEGIGVSLYDTQTALSAYVNDVVGVNGNDKHDSNKVENPVTVGNAGAYVGYGDSERGFHSFIMSNLTHGASTSTYSAWQGVVDDNANKDSVYAYARYGRVLADSGLDQTASVGMDPVRAIVGAVTMLLYALSEFVPKMFGLCLKVLQIFNPFQFLSKSRSFSSWWASAFPSAPDELTSLVKWVSGGFDVIVNDITWTVMVPLFIAFVAVQVLLLRKPAATPLLNLVKRVAFFAIGLPICAGLYTGVLNSLGDITMKDTASSQIVVSTFVDFESWATGSRLAVPGEALVASAPTNESDKTAYKNASSASSARDVNGGTATAKMLRGLRTTTYAINKENVDSFDSMGDIPSIDDAHFMFSADLWNKSADYSKVGGTAFNGLTSVSEGREVSTGIFSLLMRYMDGSFYRASDFETSFMNTLSTEYRSEMGHTGSTAGGSSNRGKVYDMFDMTDGVDDWLERGSTDTEAIFKGSFDGGDVASHLEWVRKGWNVFDDGKLKVGTPINPMESMRFTTPSGQKGLSTQSMYNYLCTSFDEHSIVVYSGRNSVSENTKQQHYSVNLVGTGALNVVFALNMIVILAVLVLIAVSFSFKLAVSNIKRGVTMIASIPMAMLGAVKSIAQVISYVIAMVFELIVSTFLYMFISTMLILVATIVETVASLSEVTGLADTVLAAAGTSSGTDVVAAVLLETFLVVVVAVFLFKYRRAYIRVREILSIRVYRTLSCGEMVPVVDGVASGKVMRGDSWLQGLASDLGFRYA